MKWTFEYDQQHTPILDDNKFSLKIDVEIRYINREEYDVAWEAYDDNDNEVTRQLSLMDKGIIEGKVWEPPQHILFEAYQDYENNQQQEEAQDE